MNTKHYIFRWKEDGICVIPSRRLTRIQVWDYAIDALRPASMKDDSKAEEFVRTHGEVIEDDE